MAEVLVLTVPVAPDLAGVRGRLAEPEVRSASVLAPLGAAGLAAASALMAAWAVILGPSDPGLDRAADGKPVLVSIAAQDGGATSVRSGARALKSPRAPPP